VIAMTNTLIITSRDVKPNQNPMKTKVLFILMLSVMSFCAQAQSIYVRAGLGAAICTSPQYGYQDTKITVGGNQNTTEMKKAGQGDGLPIFVAAGHYFGENFGVELGIDYFQGFNHKVADNDNGSITTQKIHATMLSIVPALVMKINLDKITPYARLGIMIGVLNSGILVQKMSGTSSDATKAFNYNGAGADYTAKDYGGIAIGAQAAVGAEYHLSDLLSLFGEVNLDAISWAPKKGKLTKYSEGGVDKLGTLTTKQKSWVYEKKIDYTQNIPDSEPDKWLKGNYSLANVGLVVGVKINFGK
jgi:hypothetical protein